MEERFELLQHCAQPACRVQVFHIVLAGGLEVHQNRSGIAQRIQMMQVESQSRSPRDGGQVDDAVGRSTDGKEHSHRILERLSRHDLGRHCSRLSKPNSLSAGRLGDAQAIGMNCRNCSAAGQAHSESFRNAGHRAGRTHHRAGPCGHGETVLDLGNFLAGDFARTIARPEPAAVGAGSEPLTVISTCHHGSDYKLNGRNACRNRAHKLGGNRLVAATNQDDGVHRLRPNHLLDVHRHQVAEHEARGTQKHFAERDRRKFKR